MLVLAVETSTSMGSVALLENENLVGEISLMNQMHHSQRILNMISLLLKESNVVLKDIDLLSVSVGPGSFTGLRVGVATMKGLASGLEKPLKGVPTLEAFAGQMGYTSFPICPLIPARKNEVYMALYHYVDPSQLAPLQPGKIVPLNRFWEEVEGPLHLLGELPVEWLESQSEHRFYYSPLFRHPTAHSVAQIGYRHFREKKEIPENDLDLVMPEFPSVRKQQGGLHF